MLINIIKTFYVYGAQNVYCMLYINVFCTRKISYVKLVFRNKANRSTLSKYITVVFLTLDLRIPIVLGCSLMYMRALWFYIYELNKKERNHLHETKNIS